MDQTTREIMASHGLPIQSDWAYTEAVRAAMKEYAAQEAKSYASWLGNQVIAGRTYHKLWLDYKTEVLDNNPLD